MNLKNRIGYCSATWNPIVMQCNPISEGCKNCWHLRMVKRLQKNPLIPFPERLAYKEQRIILREKELTAPLRRKKPEIIAVQLMGDLFHKDVKFEWLRDIFRMMMGIGEHRASQHTYLLLTKRPARLLEWMRINYDDSTMHRFAEKYKNIWLGVSVENQARADERIPILLSIPAAKHFISVEPMLEPLALQKYFYLKQKLDTKSRSENWLDWVIAGPETGPKVRECKPEWIEGLHEQCRAAEVPFWDKRPKYIARERPK